MIDYLALLPAVIIVVTALGAILWAETEWKYTDKRPQSREKGL